MTKWSVDRSIGVGARSRSEEGTRERILRGALRAALLYAILGAVWIVFSDLALQLAVSDPDVRNTVQTYKGLIFVALSAIAVGILAYRELARERAASDQLAALAEMSAAGICVLQDDRVVVANQRAAEMLGATSPGDLEGRDVLDFVTPGDGARFRARVSESVEEDHHRPQRITLRRLDGSEILVEIETRVVEWQGRTAEIGVMIDVTHVEEAAARERARERLETIGQLTAAISHDLRNMLTTISMPLELAAESMDPGRDGHAYIHEAIQATERAGGLTRQLLAFGRPGLADPQPVDLASYLEELEPMLQRAAGPGVVLNLDVETDLPALEIDPSGLSQVLLNLVLNASEAMDSKGRVTIGVRAVDGDMPGDRAGLRIVVEDSGPGLDRTIVHNLFEPFFTTKAEGTGLGLATVRRIVEESRGTIRPDLDTETGARFVLEFPASDRSAVPTRDIRAVETGPERSAHAARVLLAEDEHAIRRAIRRGLERAGFDVHGVGSCDGVREALAKEGPPDIFVVDIRLPDGSGAILASDVAADHPGVGIVMMSGEVTVDQAPDIPGAMFVGKPFSIPELIAAVREAGDHIRLES